MTPEQLAEIKARAEKASPGRKVVVFKGDAEGARPAILWGQGQSLKILVDKGQDFTDPLPDAVFISEAYADVPGLLAYVEELEKKLESIGFDTCEHGSVRNHCPPCNL